MGLVLPTILTSITIKFSHSKVVSLYGYYYIYCIFGATADVRRRTSSSSSASSFLISIVLMGAHHPHGRPGLPCLCQTIGCMVSSLRFILVIFTHLNFQVVAYCCCTVYVDINQSSIVQPIYILCADAVTMPYMTIQFAGALSQRATPTIYTLQFVGLFVSLSPTSTCARQACFFNRSFSSSATFYLPIKYNRCRYYTITLTSLVSSLGNQSHTEN